MFSHRAHEHSHTLHTNILAPYTTAGRKDEAIKEAMQVQKMFADEQWKDKMQRTFLVMNRKELNDENNLQRLEEIRQKGREYMYLYTCIYTFICIFIYTYIYIYICIF